LLKICKACVTVSNNYKIAEDFSLGLFQPLVEAVILRPEDLIGYRRSQVYIRGSRHIPFPREALLDAMEAFFDVKNRNRYFAALESASVEEDILPLTKSIKE
jgi:hypothetical protein